MAEKESVVHVPRITFCMKIPKISQLTTAFSPTFLVQGIPWKVSVDKSVETPKELLAVYLHCEHETDESTDWSYAASMSVIILSWDKNTPDLDKECSSYVYDSNEGGYGTGSLIEWDELFLKENNYVRNDTINLEIKIEVADPLDEKKSQMKIEKVDQSCKMGCVTTLAFTVANFQNLIAVRSSKFTVHKLDSYLIVYKNDLNQLGVSIHLDSDEMKCKAKLRIKVISSKIEAKTITRSIKDEDDEDFNCFDTNVASLQDLEKPENGFINNDCLSMEVEIRVGCCQFVNEANTQHDEVNLKLECSICLQTINNDKDISSTPCGHIFCTSCVHEAIQTNQLCPLCKSVTTLDTIRRIYLST